MSEVSAQVQVQVPPEQPQPSASPDQAPSRSGGLLSLQSLATTIVIAIFVITFIVQAFQIPSESMEKTLLIGDYLLVDKAHYGHCGAWQWLMPYRPIQRQDIIVFRYPVNPHQHFVKRVVAIPGDHVRLVDKHVYVNGVRQDDSYANFKWAWRDRFRDDFPDGGFYGDNISAKWFLQVRKLVEDGELIVPEGSYFVLGDNRDDSYDSRYWGFVPAENVVGRPLVIYWSMDRATPEAPGEAPSDKLSNLTLNVAHLFNSLRWHRMLRVPH
ncbi:MAG: signal peptidase I [Candidatus Korobacteraceae bacterium]